VYSTPMGDNLDANKLRVHLNKACAAAIAAASEGAVKAEDVAVVCKALFNSSMQNDNILVEQKDAYGEDAQLLDKKDRQAIHDFVALVSRPLTDTQRTAIRTELLEALRYYDEDDSFNVVKDADPNLVFWGMNNAKQFLEQEINSALLPKPAQNPGVKVGG